MKRKKRSWLLVFVVLAVSFFVANRILFFSPTSLEHYASKLIYPVLYTQRSVVDYLHNRMRKRQTIEQLRNELHQVMHERDELYAENVALQTSLSYADEIKEVHAFKARYTGHDPLIAHILLRHINEDSHYIIVDAGSEKGIAVDMPVVYKNCLLGRVIEVWPWYSKIVLTTDATCKIAAECVATKVRGIHQGATTGTYTSLTHVSHLLKLKKNDLVISSGAGLVFPRGFSLGNIDHFSVEGLYYMIKIRPPYSIHCIDCCCILRN